MPVWVWCLLVAATVADAVICSYVTSAIMFQAPNCTNDFTIPERVTVCTSNSNPNASFSICSGTHVVISGTLDFTTVGANAITANTVTIGTAGRIRFKRLRIYAQNIIILQGGIFEGNGTVSPTDAALLGIPGSPGRAVQWYYGSPAAGYGGYHYAPGGQYGLNTMGVLSNATTYGVLGRPTTVGSPGGYPKMTYGDANEVTGNGGGHLWLVVNMLNISTTTTAIDVRGGNGFWGGGGSGGSVYINAEFWCANRAAGISILASGGNSSQGGGGAGGIVAMDHCEPTSLLECADVRALANKGSGITSQGNTQGDGSDGYVGKLIPGDQFPYPDLNCLAHGPPPTGDTTVSSSSGQTSTSASSASSSTTNGNAATTSTTSTASSGATTTTTGSAATSASTYTSTSSSSSSDATTSTTDFGSQGPSTTSSDSSATDGATTTADATPTGATTDTAAEQARLKTSPIAGVSQAMFLTYVALMVLGACILFALIALGICALRKRRRGGEGDSKGESKLRSRTDTQSARSHRFASGDVDENLMPISVGETTTNATFGEEDTVVVAGMNNGKMRVAPAPPPQELQTIVPPPPAAARSGEETRVVSNLRATQTGASQEETLRSMGSQEENTRLLALQSVTRVYYFSEEKTIVSDLSAMWQITASERSSVASSAGTEPLDAVTAHYSLRNGRSAQLREQLASPSTTTLGTGLTADVYGVKYDRNTTVAVKKFKLDYAGALAEFHAEVAALSRVANRSHPHVLGLVYICAEPSLYAIVVDMAENGSLAACVGGSLKLSGKARRASIAGVASGMAFLHLSGVVHLDLKPANVLRGKGGVVKIADFGTSVIVDAGDLVTTTAFVGTLRYSAPERLLPGQQIHLKPTDVYSFGMLAWAVCAGTTPTMDSDDAASISSARTSVAVTTTLPKRWSGDDDIYACICKCCDPDPNLRPTFDEVIDMFSKNDS